MEQPQLVEMHLVSAEEEFRKNPELQITDLIALREWMSSEKHLPQIADEMLILFHHSCYYNLDQTKNCIENYYTIRTHTREFFTNRDVTNLQLSKAVEALDTMVLPTTDNDGNRIIYQGLRDFNPSNYMHVEGIILMYMTMDAFFRCNGTCDGFVIVYTMQGASLTHLFKTSITILRKSFHYMQEANPIRLKAIHIIHVVPWVNKILALVKPIVKKEILDLVHFYQEQDMDLFYEHIPRSRLPKEFGGSLQSLKELSAENTALLASLTSYFTAEERFRVDESLRVKKETRR